MGYRILAILILLVILVTACNSATGNVPRAPPPPSGGGCGIAAPINWDKGVNGFSLEKSTAGNEELRF